MDVVSRPASYDLLKPRRMKLERNELIVNIVPKETCTRNKDVYPNTYPFLKRYAHYYWCHHPHQIVCFQL